MKYLSLFLLAFLFLFSAVSAKTQITTFGYPYGIVSDTDEWTCTVGTSTLSGSQSAIGVSKSLSILNFNYFYLGSLVFSSDQKLVFASASQILARYALKTNTVMSNVSIKGTHASHYTITGSYIDNTSSGFFALHIMKDHFGMFVMLKSNLFDDTSKDFIMSKPLELITPLFSPRTLSAILGIDFESYSDCIILEE